MSLGDQLRLLRAKHGGLDTNTIAEALGLETPSTINSAETRYRPVEDETLIEKLAAYYEQPVEEFHWHNARARKYLTFYVEQAMKEEQPLELTLRDGQVLTGRAEWWDLSSIGLRNEAEQLLVVQRHAVVDWPNATDHWWDEEE